MILPQQRLLLELLSMSGDIAVPFDSEDSIVWRTLNECQDNGWVRVRDIGSGMHRVSVTAVGRVIVR